MSNIRVTIENPQGAMALALIGRLSAELAAHYPQSDGSGAFSPEDVLVPRAAFVIAWDGEEPVGCGALRPMDDSTIGEIKRMYVIPTARGRGISRLILTTLEDLARGFAYQKLMLETGIRQIEALGLYEKTGYQRTACYGIYVDNPISVCFEKILATQIDERAKRGSRAKFEAAMSKVPDVEPEEQDRLDS
jgi:putative acetyltransferase